MIAYDTLFVGFVLCKYDDQGEEDDRVRGANVGKREHNYTIKILALAFLLRYLLLASWLLKATQLLKAAHARGCRGMSSREHLKFCLSEVAF